MGSWVRAAACFLVALFLILLTVGCASHEHREVRVIEQQSEGEVEDVSPGEMIVE